MGSRYVGGIITTNPVEPTEPYQDSAANGVWSLTDAYAYTKAGVWPTAGNAAPQVFFFGGNNSSTGYVTTIQAITPSSAGNATDFGDQATAGGLDSGVGTPTRVVFGGTTSGTLLEYFSPTTSGVVTSFGSLNRNNSAAGAIGNSTYGLFGPRNAGAYYDFERITIASTGNAANYGDLLRETYNYGGGINNTTQGLVFGGYDSQVNFRVNYISKKAITSSSNSSDFGDMVDAMQYPAGACSDTRGVIGGGETSTRVSTIQYLTIATNGNASTFGNLTVARAELGAGSSKVTACFGGGRNTSSVEVNTIDSITIATTGNAVDFGDLLQSLRYVGGVGTNHGGIA